MLITQIRNATICVEYQRTKFLIDPWLGPKDYMPGFEAAINSDVRQPRVDLPFPIEKIVAVDCVIVTHIHPDHWDEYAENAIPKDMKIFVQSEFDKKFLSTKHFQNVEVLTSQGCTFNGVSLFKTNTQHGQREILKPLCEAIGMPYDAMGVVFKANNEKTLYVAGDTIYCPEVEQALAEFNPDVIVVNACGATVLNGERLIMTQDDLKLLLAKVPTSIIIASHMDTVSHLTVTRADLTKFKVQHELDNLLIPNDGETLKI